MENGVSRLAVERLVKFDGGGSLKAYVDLKIGDALLIKGVRVVEGRNGLFVSMPRQQGKNARWYDLVVALTKETKQEMNRVVLQAYRSDEEAVM